MQTDADYPFKAVCSRGACVKHSTDYRRAGVLVPTRICVKQLIKGENMRVSLKAITLSSAILWGGAMLFVGLIQFVEPPVRRRLLAEDELGLCWRRHRSQAGTRAARHTLRVSGWWSCGLAVWHAIQRIQRRPEDNPEVESFTRELTR